MIGNSVAAEYCKDFETDNHKIIKEMQMNDGGRPSKLTTQDVNEYAECLIS